MSDIGTRKDDIYQGKRYGFDQAASEALKVRGLVGGNATAERYQLASDIITARLEKEEIITLERYTIPRLEPLVQSAELFGELVGQFLSKYGHGVTAQSPLDPDKLADFMSGELERRLYGRWDIDNDRGRYMDYQRDLRLKRDQLSRASSAFFETFSGDGNILVSESEARTAIELFNAENTQKLEEARVRLEFLKADDRVLIRGELGGLEAELTKEPAVAWVKEVVERTEADESKRDISNRHRWVAATRADRWGRGFEAQVCCTRCGMSFSKSPDGESRQDGEWGYFARELAGETGNMHRWSRLYRGKGNAGGGGEKSYHKGMYQLVAVVPHNLQTGQAGRCEIVQDQDGGLFSAQHSFVRGRTGKGGSQEVTLLTVTKEQVAEAIQKTEDYFPGYTDVSVLRDVPALELQSAPNKVRRGLEQKRISEVELQLPLGLTPESVYQIVTRARDVEYSKDREIDFEVLGRAGVPEELFGVISRYAQLVLNNADHELYKFQDTQSRFSVWSADCSSAVLVAILLHPDFRGPAQTLYWLHPTVSAYAGGQTTFQPGGVGKYVNEPLDLFSQSHYDVVSRRSVRVSSLVRETAAKLRSTPNKAGLVIGYRGSGVNLFRRRLSFVAGRDIEVEVIPPDMVDNNL